MNMNKLYKSLILLLGIGLTLSGCQTPGALVEEIDYDRVLTPLKFEAEVVPSTGTDVVFSWQDMTNAEGYELEIFEQTDGSKEVTPESNGTKVGETYILNADENPFTVYGLEVDKSFYARIRGINPEVPSSNWAYLEKTFSTSAVRSSLHPKVTDRTSSTVTLAWDDAVDKADLTSVQVETVVGGGDPVKVAVSAGEAAAASKTIEGLDPAREYRFTLLFGKAGNRGSVTAFTRPVLDGVNTVYTASEIYNAVNNQSGTIKLLLAYSDAGVDMMDAYPDPAVKLVTVKGDVYLYGDATAAGAKPVLKTVDFNLAEGAKVLHLEDLVLEGSGVGALAENLSADMTAVEYVNCEISGFAKAIYSVASSASAANVATFLVEGCYVHDINAAGTEGGDFIDVRAGANGDFIVRNSTFYACARTFFRLSDNAKVNSVLSENCTYNLVTATNSSSNNAGIFAVRVKTGAKSVKAVKNVFLNEFSEKEDANTTWVRLCRNSTDSYRPDCSDNVYYNTSAAWYVSVAVASETDAQGDKTFEEVAKNGATLLEKDPCVNSIAGKLYLAGTEGGTIKSLKAGDPRWWDAVQPVIIREKELKLVEDEYTWDFTEKTIYDTEELLENTIIGNARIYATATVPANVVMSKGIDFSTTAAVSPAGVPSYSAVEILTSGYGAVKVTATSDANPGTLQVLAGGDRYAVLADGEEHTVLLGDLTGENSIYVIADNAITLKKITWTKDLTPDPVLAPIATPKLSVAPAKLEVETAEAVTFAWNEVENAADYVLNFNGTESVLTETSFTLAAEAVAALAVGEYPVTVKARPVSTSSKYAESELAEATLTIVAKPTGGEVTLTWDFTADFKETINVADEQFYLYKAGAVSPATAPFTTEGLYFAPYKKALKNNKKACTADGINYQPISYGGGDAYIFLYTAKSGKLRVTATVGKSVSETGNCKLGLRVGPAPDKMKSLTVYGTDVDLVCYDPSVAGMGAVTYEWDIENATEAPQVIAITKPSGSNSPWVYKVEFVYSDGAPAEDYVWDMSSAEWQAALAAQAPAANNSDQTNWSVTLDGLTFNTVSKSKWNTGGYIQLGGASKEASNDRVFTFSVKGPGTVTVVASNTKSEDPSTRAAVVKDAEKEQKGTMLTSTSQVTDTFDVAAGDIKVYGTSGIRVYKIEFHSK